MNVIEFTTQLTGADALPIPLEIAAKLPNSGRARVIVLTEDDPDDRAWQDSAYEQFLRDDVPQDAAYESLI
jgi:hypothetical protein